MARTTVFGDDDVEDDEWYSGRNVHRIIDCMAGLMEGIVRASTGTAHDSDPRFAARRWRAPLESLLTGRGPCVALLGSIFGLRMKGIFFPCRKRRHHCVALAPSRAKNRVLILEARALARVALLVLLRSGIVARCAVTCRTCGLEKPSIEVDDDAGQCRSCRGEIIDVRADAPAPASMYLKPDAIENARCEQPLGLIGYMASAGGLHFRCRCCGESVYLPEVAIERVERR